MKGGKRLLLATASMAAILLAIMSPFLVAEPETRAPVHHFPEGTPKEAPSFDWYQTPAIYLVRLESPPLAIRHARQARLEKAESGASDSRPEPLNLETQSSRDWLANLDGERENFLEKASRSLGRDLDVVFTYRLANNGFAAHMTPMEADRLAALSGVRFIQRDYELELQTDAGPEWIGAPSIWQGTAMPGLTDYRGEGVVIGVIDTGINYSNPSFADQGHRNPLGDGVFLGDCSEGEPYEHYCNNKLIGVRGYEVTSWDDSEILRDGDPVDSDGHGSHVAGTAAGNPVSVEQGQESFDISGVAPDANIISYDSCCWVSTLTRSIDNIVADYAYLRYIDPEVRMVVNYSIGSYGGASGTSPWEHFDSQGFLAAREAGVLAFAGAGNEGPDYGTMQSAGYAPWVVAMSATTHDRLFRSNVSATGPEPVPEELEDLLAAVGGQQPGADFDNLSARYAGSVDPGNEFGCEAFPSGVFADAIAVVRRGNCTQFEHAKDAGAAAVILVETIPGPSWGFGYWDSIELPTFRLDKVDGDKLISWLAEHDDATLSTRMATASNDPEEADRVVSFSSRGPTSDPRTGVLKPDIAAPGVSILAPHGQHNAIEWTYASGTSMSTPIATGAAALLMGAQPDWSNAAIVSALVLSAERAVTVGDNGKPAGPHDIGGGRLDLESAVNVGFVLDESPDAFRAADPERGGNPADLNLATLSTGGCSNECALTRTLTGTANGDYYSVSVDAPEGLSVDVSPSSFSIAEGETLDLTFSFDNIHDALGTGGWVIFEADGDSPDLAMPFGLDGNFASVEGRVFMEGAINSVMVRVFESGHADTNPTSELVSALTHEEDGEEFLPIQQALEANRHYERIELSAVGYSDRVLDNQGDGWEPAPGDTIDLGQIHMDEVPMVVELEETEHLDQNSASLLFRVDSGGWEYTYQASLFQDGREILALDSERLDDTASGDLIRVELTDLSCSTSFNVELTASRDGDRSEETLVHPLRTESCFQGGGCSLAPDNQRPDPIIPIILILALIGIRRQSISKTPMI